MFIMYSLDVVTPTILDLFGIKTESKNSAIVEIKEERNRLIEDKPVERMLLYAPDAIGEWLYQKYPKDFLPVEDIASIMLEVESMAPSVTPVCFASMFTGMKPKDHGIKSYEKPVLKVETVFDTLVKAGKRVALVAVKDCSIDLIFRNREIDYYSEPYDKEVEDKVIELLKEDKYDLILAYNQSYDDTMHSSTPESPESIKAFQEHIRTFSKLAAEFNNVNKERNRVLAFLPDHGTHIDPATGKGTHGTELREDMEVRHFWGIYKGEKSNMPDL